MTELTPSARNLTTPYTGVALYFEDADTVEYIRQDIPAVHRRIDGVLTLLFNMADREELIGFQIKGFRNFYLQDAVRQALGDDFLSLVGILERVCTAVGGPLLDVRKEAYDRARKIALEDKVELQDLPKLTAAG